ncbi:MAG: hypothetical protein HQL87_12165 [Magnetococcales bacterium]|nr:hypothetical protein [Magnetococcales bacterium]
MAITQSFAVELLAGETLKVAGPGLIEFSAAEAVPAKLVAGTKGAAAAAAPMQVGAGTGKAVIHTGIDPTLLTSAGTGSKAVAGTLWNGKGLSLGLGLGLGAWGPTLLVTAVTVGGYLYWKHKQSAKIWPF